MTRFSIRTAYAALLGLIFIMTLAPIDACAAPLPRMAIILPGTCNDMAWSQAMCESVWKLQPETGYGAPLSLLLRENLWELSAAEKELRTQAAQGTEIVLLHGTQYLPLLRKLAPLYPNTTFVYGGGDRKMGDNVIVYDTQPQEGAYLMGMAAGLMTHTNQLSLIAPVDVNDAVNYARGFEEGVKSTNPQAELSVVYTGSFNSRKVARKLALRHLQDGVDIMTGTSHQSLGALDALKAFPDVLWAGNTYDISKLSPSTVFAVQVYDFKPLLRYVLDTRIRGGKGGLIFPMSLSKGGMRLEWTSLVPPSVQYLVDKHQQEIMTGNLKLDIRVLRYHSFSAY